MTSGRYQSRFLSFLSQQSLRLQDQSGQFWRQAKLAAVWGTQIFLYPLYVAFQTSRLATKQLKHTAKSALPQVRATLKRSTLATGETPALNTDAPIRKTLEQIQAFEISLPANQIVLQPAVLETALIESKRGKREAERQARKQRKAREKQLSAHSSPNLKVRGIATLLESRQLVLATINNQLLDILTTEQQNQLQRQMIWELADFHRERRRLGLDRASASQPRLVNSFLPLPSERPYAILPVRWFYQLMSWEQQGAIAAATNLFQEAQLALMPVRPKAALPNADRSLRSAQLNWSPIGEWSQAFAGNRQNITGDSLLGRLQTSVVALIQLPEQIIHKLTQEKSIVPYNSPADAVNQPSPASSPSQPWLTMESLFSRAADPSSQPNGATWELLDTAAIEAATKARLTKLRQAEEANPNQLAQANRTEVTQWRSVDRAVVPSTATASAISVVSRPETKLDTRHVEPEGTIELNSTWIEAKVTTVGYVKHPLEQLLGWLDRSMVWLEDRLTNLWGWLRDRLK
ncbi:MAG TPA: hypothetical protein V6D10_14905 [Trichocoleus sp.]|jgi:hypothetical protein